MRLVEKLAHPPFFSSRRKIFLTFLWGIILHWGLIPPLLIFLFRKLDRFLPSLALITPYNYILGGGSILVGIIWTVAAILDQWNIGKGTFVPSASPVRRLVTEGAYRYTRNPMYLGYIFLIGGVGLILNSLSLIFALLPLIVLFLIIYSRLVEERVLILRFGEEYENYRENTPFLFPLPLKSLGWRLSPSLKLIFSILIILGISSSAFIFYNAFSLNSQRFGKIIWHGPRDRKVIALTFDDGPNPPYTEEILDILKKYHVKATFFLIGLHVDEYPDLVRRIVKEGHAVGNHTYSHSDLVFDGKKRIEEEIERAEESIYKASGIKPRLIRLPRNWRKPEVFQIAEDKGYTIVSLSKRGFDWTNPGVKKIVRRILKNLKPGDIIGLHDGDGDHLVYQQSRQQTVEALPLLIQEIKKRGFQFVTLPEMLSYLK